MSKEALKLALEALEHLQPTALTSFYTIGDRDKAIAALREALAQERSSDEQPALAEQEPVLQDIEQYRMQMAGICTAAIGYWKEGDSIHPDYDTLALRDVAKLYAKYDELYRAQGVSHGMIAGALFDFMGWLTTRPKRIMLSSADDASPAVDAIKDFAKMRGLSLDDARVQDWQEALAEQPAQQEPVGSITVSHYKGLENHEFDYWGSLPDGTHNLFTSPPAQRKPLTDEQKRDLIKKSELWDMHIHIGWYSAPAKSFVEKAIQLIADIEAAHGIKENT